MTVNEIWKSGQHGYTISKCEILSADKATPEELAEDPDHPWPDGFVLFRCIVHYPGREDKYVSIHVASRDELETQEFWKNFWGEVNQL
jgi:hypothetical protein